MEFYPKLENITPVIETNNEMCPIVGETPCGRTPYVREDSKIRLIRIVIWKSLNLIKHLLWRVLCMTL